MDPSEITRTSQGEMDLDGMTGRELLNRVQALLEQDPELDKQWIELFYIDTWKQEQFMRLWMRPQGHHVSSSRH